MSTSCCKPVLYYRQPHNVAVRVSSLGILPEDVVQIMSSVKLSGAKELELAQHRADKTPQSYIPVIQGLCSHLMDFNNIQIFSDMEIKKWCECFFEPKNPVGSELRTVYFPDVNKKICVEKLIIASRVLAFILSKNGQISQIQMYCDIAHVVRSLPELEQQILLQACRPHLPCAVEDLAMLVTSENINYVMSRLKLSINLPLLYEFACSPSFTGKIVALWQLLEVNDFLWITTPWDKIQNALVHFYKILAWLMQKAQIFSDFVSEGVSWVHAKCFSDGSELAVPPELKLSEDVYYEATSGTALHEFARKQAAEPKEEIKETCLVEPLVVICFQPNCPQPAFIGCKCGIHVCRQHNVLGMWCLCVERVEHMMSDCTCTIITDTDLSESTATLSDDSETSSSTCDTDTEDNIAYIQRVCPENFSPVDTPVVTPEMSPTEAKKVEKLGISAWIESLRLHEIGAKVLAFFENVFVDVVGFFDTNPMFAGILALAASMTSLLGFTLPFFTGGFEVKRFCKNLADGMRCAYYANKGSEGLLTAFGGVVNTMKELCGVSTDQPVIAFKTKVAEMLTMAQGMHDVAIANPGKFMNDSQAFGQFKQQMESIKSVYRELAEQKNVSASLQSIMPIWNQLNKTYTDLATLFSKFVSSVSERQIPVVIWLYGTTDLGKSTVLSYIADELNRHSKRSMQVFTLSKGPEYWNGYAQHDIIKIDDFGVWIGPEGNTDALSMFNLVTNAAYNPNMASLSDKNTMATPKFVFIAANCPTVPLNSGVQEIRAFERRRHLFVTVTWDGHEDVCDLGSHKCKHWLEVKAKNKDVINDFSHLQFRICDPIVSYPLTNANTVLSRDKRMTQDIYSYELKTKERIINTGTLVTIDQLVQRALELEAEHSNVFQNTMRRKIESGSLLLQSNQVFWTEDPTLVLSGPPGCGKTTVLTRVIEKRRVRRPDENVREIDGIDSFEQFVKDGFQCTKPSIVYFHDVSDFTSHEKFKDFIEALIDRSNKKRLEVDTWIMAVNADIFESAILAVYKSYEKLTQVMRRTTVIDFTFQKYFSFWGNKAYTANDLSEAMKKLKADEKLDIEKYVLRTLGSDSMSYEQTVDYLCSYAPSMSTTYLHDELRVYTDFQPKACVQIKMTVNDFTELCSNCTPLGVATALIRGETKVSSNTLSFSELANMLYAAVRKSKCSGGKVLSLDALLLEAWNAGHLTIFKGHNIIVSFIDQTYCIEGEATEVAIGKFVLSHEAVRDVVDSLQMSTRQIETSDLLSVGANLLPPWFTMCGELVLTMGKTIATGLMAAKAVQQQSHKLKALSMYENVAATAENYATKKLDSIHVETQARLFPGLGAGAKTPQHGSIDYEDPLQESQVMSPPPLQESTDPCNVKPPSFRKESTDPPKVIPHNVRSRQVFPSSAEAILDATKEVTFDNTKQVASDPSIPLIVNCIASNCVDVLNAEGGRLCYGVMIEKLLGTTVNHITEVYKGQMFIQTISKQRYPIKIVKQDPNIDRLDFEVIDTKCPQFKSIVNHISSVDAPPSHRTQGTMITVNHEVSKSFPVIQLRAYVIEGMKITTFLQDPKKYYHINYTGHKAGTTMVGVQTYSGDCGSLLLVADPNWQHGKLIGMHVGAGSSEGFARLMHREHYETRIHEARPSFQIPINNPEHLDLETVIPIFDEGRKVGISKKKQFVPHRTNLYRNLAEVGPRVFEPAIMSATDVRNPDSDVLRKEAFKWMRDRPTFTAKERVRFQMVFDQMADYYADVFAREDVNLSVLTRMEAINKLGGCSKSEPINIKTSPGFPFTDIAKSSGKRDFIRSDEHGLLWLQKGNKYAKFLKTRMDAYNDEVAGTKVASCVFKVFLKDEPVKLKKIYDVASTRTIAAAPLDFQIVFRQYLHAAMANVAEKWSVLPPKIGINASSLDWNTLFHKLASKSTTALDIDYVGWDFCPHPWLVSQLARFWNRIYRRCDLNWKPIDDEMRRVLYSKVSEFFMLVGCSIYKATGGIPSGYPGTSIDNSIINDVINCAIYIEMMETLNPNLANVFSWFEDVASATYGDDRLMTLSRYLFDRVDLKWYQKRLAEYGFEATGADKKSDLHFKPLLQCMFMSRGFKKLSSFIVGPLNPDRMWKTTWWVHDKPGHQYDPNRELQACNSVNIMNAYLCVLHEAALHDKETYTLAYQAASKARSLLDSNEPLPAYEEMISRVFGMTGVRHLHSDGVETFDESELLEHFKIPATYKRTGSFTFQSRTVTHFGPAYCYGGAKHPWTVIPQHLQILMRTLNEKYDKNWNSVLVNEYARGGMIPWHKDDEEEIVGSSGIGCITACGDGQMQFKHSNEDFFEFAVGKGSFYIISPENARNWQHRRINHFAPKTISFTFRHLDT